MKSAIKIHSKGLVSLLLLLIAVPFLNSKTLLVPTQYRTIQSAIDKSRTGDTVLVDEGTYFENIVIRKNIVLASRYILHLDTSHIAHTIIDGSRPRDSLKGSVIYLCGKTDTNCVVTGFTIRHGTGTYVHYSLEPGLNPNATGVNEHWIAGGGIFANHTGARIAHNILTENTVATRFLNNYSFGAAIAAQESTFGKHLPSPIIIEYNTICNNLSTGVFSEGAGIDLVQPAIIRFNTIIDNRTVSKTRSIGGAITIGMSGDYNIVVDGNYISRNSAGIAGGILITSGFVRRGCAIITNNIISDNQSFEVGGAVNVAELSYAIFINNTIVRNTALSHAGGINITSGANAVLVNNILWNNSLDQVSIWGTVQGYNNVVEGELPGKDNTTEDPSFLPNDTLFRLSPNSPCIGTGLAALRLLDKSFPLPDHDYFSSKRFQTVKPFPDIGAIESPWEGSSRAHQILRDRKSTEDAYVKLTVIFRQISGVERRPGTQEIIRAGQMQTTVIVNDSSRHVFDNTDPNLSFVLPPDNNLVELELMGQARDTTKRLNVYYRLEGAESSTSILPRRVRFAYTQFANLKPGNYQLTMQPQDDEDIIGHTNRIGFNILVLPFWYQRWWAYLLYGVCVIGIAFTMYRVQMKRLELEHSLLKEHLHADKLAEINKLKSRFFENITHELRTPITMILGPIDSIITQSHNKDHVEQLGYMQRNARKLLRLIEQLLQFSRLEAGTVRLHVFHQDIVPFLRRITGYFSSQTAKKQIDLKFHSEQPSIDGWFDEEKVEHMLMNCLTNAIKYTHAGGTIEVRIRQDQNDLVFSVRDTGDGIAPEHLPFVFDRFYRIDHSHKIEGTGIGLSLTKELVEIHHGTIHLESEFGKGTLVTIRIPLSGYPESDIVSKSHYIMPSEAMYSEEHNTTGGHTGHTNDQPIILIAEDNDDARGYIISQLSKHYNIIESVDGEDALNKTKFQIPDLVISDVMMPKMNGRELCRALKHDERTCHIPVILLTALSEMDDKIEGLSLGADDYLIKPFDVIELMTRVKNLLENRRILREAYGKTTQLQPGEISVSSLDDAFLTKALEIVSAHIAEPGFGVEIMAHEIFLSRTQLQRKLKAITNLNPSEFIRHLRLKRAKDLLEKNSGTVAEIADRVGFNNHSYFAKCFQEQFGILPSEVRQLQK